ncbi:MAG: dihydrofolate reductase [Oscillospiraceae bacterium]|nr:dihydrofolate reductase [Oscillospiraceae bacterium]
MIALIAARSQNNVIGRQGRIPWNIPGEQRQFRELTTNHVVIMGRRTYEEIGHPLPNRINVIVSRIRRFTGENLYTVSSLPQAIALFPDQKLFIAGGAGLFAEAIPIADSIYLTEIHTIIPDGDTFFPAFRIMDFEKEILEEGGEEIRYTRTVYHRKGSTLK